MVEQTIQWFTFQEKKPEPNRYYIIMVPNGAIYVGYCAWGGRGHEEGIWAENGYLIHDNPDDPKYLWAYVEKEQWELVPFPEFEVH